MLLKLRCLSRFPFDGTKKPPSDVIQRKYIIIISKLKVCTLTQRDVQLQKLSIRIENVPKTAARWSQKSLSTPDAHFLPLKKVLRKFMSSFITLV